MEFYLLLDRDRRPRPVSCAALAGLFRALKGRTRLVVLNACSSRPQAEAVAEEVDCVVGMGRAISDGAAIDFAASFYRALGFGRSVRNVFDQARVAIRRKDLCGLSALPPAAREIARGA
jgi:hypothetical protein